MNRRHAKIVEVQLTTAAAAYSANDQLGVAIEIPFAMNDDGGHASITSLVLLDKALQSDSTDLFFFDEEPVVASADNAAVSITDAEMADKCLGAVNIPVANYIAVAASSIAAVNDIKLKVKAIAKNKSIWVLAVTRGTPTYASTTDLVLRVGLDQD